MKPLAIDLFSGLGGWAEGLLAEGYDVVGFDIERHHYGDQKYPAQLVLQDVLTLHGSQFRNAAVIVASPPCQAYSYRAMPWKRAKALPPPSNELFDACFRIQRQASEAAGHHIPMVVENVKGAQPWVGRAAWHYGSFYLWGDVPALMLWAFQKSFKGSGNWFAPRIRKDGSIEPISRGKAKGLESDAVDGLKTVGHVNIRDGHTHTRHLTNQRESDAVKNGNDWFGSGPNCSLQRKSASGSLSRKAASAQIAKIPFALASHIAKVYKPSGI